MTLRVEGSWNSSAVFEDDQRITDWFTNRDLAHARLERIQQERKVRARSCLKCGDEFISTGNHHRMCDKCRRHSEGMI